MCFPLSLLCLLLLCAAMSACECVCFRIPAGLLFTQDRLTAAFKWHYGVVIDNDDEEDDG